MKSYRITVNGNVYDVTVEETTGNGAALVQQSAAPAPQLVKTAGSNTTVSRKCRKR